VPAVHRLVTDPERPTANARRATDPSSSAAVHEGSGKWLVHPISGQPGRPVLFGAITAPTFIRFQQVSIIRYLSGFIRFCRVRLRYPGEITSS
jgi:hypothetical protein